MSAPLMGIDGGCVSFSGAGATSGNPLHVVGWTVNREKALTEVTECGMTERVFKGGLGTSSGTITVLADDTTSIMQEGEYGQMKFHIKGTIASPSKIIDVEVIIESYSISWQPDGRIEVTYNWRQSGVGTSADYSRT